MALTKAQVSLVTVASLGVAPGGYLNQLQEFNTQKEAAAFIATTGLLNVGTNAEFAMQVAENLGVAKASASSLFQALENGASRADALVDFANAQFVQAGGSLAKVTRAENSTSTSMDLEELKAAVAAPTPPPAAPNTTVVFTDNETDQSSGAPQAVPQIIKNIGKREIDRNEGKISADYTFVLEDQIGSGDTFTGLFLSPIIDRQAASTTGSQLFLDLLDLRAAADEVDPLVRIPVDTFAFTLNGVRIDIQSEAIYEAQTYPQLLAAITQRIEELGNGVNVPETNAEAYAALASFTVQPGNQFRVTDHRGVEVSGTTIVITDEAGAELEPLGFANKAGVIADPGYTLYAQLDNVAPTTITQLITTNLEATNVGYGSQGGSVNLVGQSDSDKGVEEIKVTAKEGVWFSRLESSTEKTNHLERIEIQAGSEGYFRVGTQINDPLHLVALVDEEFGDAGLVDVQQFFASNAGSVAVNSYITNAVINRFDLEDTGIFTADDGDAAIAYNLTSGNDVLQLRIDSEVVAYADTKVDINTGAGNDFVHLQIQDSVGFGESWLENQQLNDNINITTTAGNNTIWFEGSGNARITTGNGNDTILADNSGRQAVTDAGAVAKLASMGATVYGTTPTVDLNGLYVFNASSLDLSDIVSNDGSTTGTEQVFTTIKEQVQVTFMGFESSVVTIAHNATNFTTNTQQINQAIKKAINEDAVLSKLLVAKEYPGNVLVVESLIDGVRTTGELEVEFTAPVSSATSPVPAGRLQLSSAEETGLAAALATAPNATVPYAVGTHDLDSVLGTQYNAAFVGDGPVTAGSPAVAEVQTIDVATLLGNAVTADGDLDVGGETVSLDVTTHTSAAAIATAIATAVDGQTLTGTTIDVTATASGSTVTLTFDAADGDVAEVAIAGDGTLAFDGAAAFTNASATEATKGDAGSAASGTAITGAASDAESDNVINAGAGNDVIVLGTGVDSNDTVVLTGNFGKTTIVNFNDSGTGIDLLDFTSYFVESNPATAGAFAAVTFVDASTGLPTTVADDEVTLINFSDLDSNGATTGGISATDTLSSVTGAKIAAELNDASVVSADATAATEHVFLIHNDTVNDGEYLVVTARSAASTDALSAVTIVGTLDFGAAVDFTGVIADFA